MKKIKLSTKEYGGLLLATIVAIIVIIYDFNTMTKKEFEKSGEILLIIGTLVFSFFILKWIYMILYPEEFKKQEDREEPMIFHGSYEDEYLFYYPRNNVSNKKEKTNKKNWSLRF